MSSKLHKKRKNRVLKRTVAVALSGMMVMSPMMYVHADDRFALLSGMADGQIRNGNWRYLCIAG